ncbi:MAG TPA: hypothetical protein VGF38_20190 [Ktedonobacterales bacterium]|jgi:hypothetical protein
MRLAAFRDNWRQVAVRLCLFLLAAFALFEIGVRLLPADAVRYQVQVSTNGGPVTTKTGTITDPATVARWRDEVTANPASELLIGLLIGQWREQYSCSGLGTFDASYVFLWHGLPIESVSLLPVCFERYQISSGGIVDPRTYNVPHLVQP